jgi:hypothetical protein
MNHVEVYRRPPSRWNKVFNFETFTVSKVGGGYRYRADSADYSKMYLSSLDKFKLKFSKNMLPEDIAIVKEEWFDKLITDK